MKISPMLIRNALSMFGLSPTSLAEQAVPSINSQLDEILSDIELEDGQSKGIIIVPDGKGEYYVVTTKFHKGASEYFERIGHIKLSSLVTNLLNKITNG